MGVYIENMEMPKPGQIVLVEIDENGDVFAAYDGGRTKLIQHKAVPVPAHGDLIDKDATMNAILEERGEDTACWFAGIVNDMPAIVPSDKAEEGE